MENTQLVHQQLYGGAITVSIPERFTDISDFRYPLNDTNLIQFRQVPDHQEAFVDANTDQSRFTTTQRLTNTGIIIELNSMVSGTDDESMSVHFEQLCDDNEAARNNILHKELLKPEDVPLIP
jgi:hypothetical protein